MTKTTNPPIVFIHGFRGSPAGLTDIAKLFQKHKTYSPSIPPFGNAAPLDEYSVESYVKFIRDFIIKNHIKKPVLVGHSMGSIIAAAVASSYPELINDKIVFLAPISQKPNKSIASLQPLSVILPRKAVDKITTDYLFVPKKEHILYKKTLAITHECSKTEAPKRDILRAAKFSTKYSIGDFKLTQKILFLSGEKDKLIKKSKTVEIARRYKDSKIIFLENTGHLLNYEAPEKVADIIQDFLNE